MSKKLISLLFGVSLILFWFVLSHNQGSSGLSSNTSNNSTIQASPTTASSSSILGANSPHCTSKDDLPDPTCTPGVISETDAYTVCHRSTKTIRPPVSYTDSLKIEQIKEYGYTDTNPRDYEEDHLIPLELGGSPEDPRNLWPEPGGSPNSKDQIENLCHQKVCSGEISLSDAQKEIASDWKTACQ